MGTPHSLTWLCIAGTLLCVGCSGAAHAGAALEGKAGCEQGMCLVPAGTTKIGSSADEPGRGAYDENQVSVTLSRAYYVADHETTRAEWTALGLRDPSGVNADGSGDGKDRSAPVGNVSFVDALMYANLLSARHEPALRPCYRLEGCRGTAGVDLTCDTVALNAKSPYECEGFRLPTEAEWEVAARAGTQDAFYSGPITATGEGDCAVDPNLESIAWYCGNAGKYTHPFGQKRPNALGLHDMLGNAAEWVWGGFDGLGYGDGPLRDPEGAALDKPARVFRGGAYNMWPTLLRAAKRLAASPASRSPGLGFRVARSAR